MIGRALTSALESGSVRLGSVMIHFTADGRISTSVIAFRRRSLRAMTTTRSVMGDLQCSESDVMLSPFSPLNRRLDSSHIPF